MASLKEIKGRIASVKSTLKITSAMKMVASAKLHKAQSAIEHMLPYEHQLQDMLQLLMRSTGGCSLPESSSGSSSPVVAIVAVSSNSSLCGGFNSNVIREVKARIADIEKDGGTVEVLSVGKKMAEAMKKAGYPSAEDWSDLVGHTSYAAVSEFAAKLIAGYGEGRWSRIEMIYNHFVSTATQKVQDDVFLPMQLNAENAGSSDAPQDIILEPTPGQLLDELLPRVQALKVYTVILDSVASEHAARTVAMQTATDNGNNILQELTLEYNKGRQQKITSEILDIVGGSMQ